MTPPDRRVAVAITVEALRRVLDPATVSALRDDSPLAAIGVTDADLACIADAIAAESARIPDGAVAVLDDGDFEAIDTVADLVAAVTDALAGERAS